MAYEKTTWQNGITPLSADNMNNIEDGVSEAIETAERALARASGGTPSGGGGSTTGAIPEVESIDNPTADSPSLVLYQGSVYVLTNIEEEEEQTNA